MLLRRAHDQKRTSPADELPREVCRLAGEEPSRAAEGLRDCDQLGIYFPPMHPKFVGIALVFAGIALGIVWVSGRIAHPFLPVLALLLFLAGSSLFGKTNQFAQRLQPFVGRSVRVLAWDSELPGHSAETFIVQSVRALGAGLHLYLRPLPQGSPIHLKIAQPREATVDDAGVTIREAKYVQWVGRKVPKSQAAIPFVLTVVGRT